MKRYPQYRVFCPEFFQFQGNTQKTALRVHIIYDEEEEKLLFRSIRAFDDEPVSLNCQARLIEVYVAMVTVAVKKLRWIRSYPPGMKAITEERSGIIDGAQVAHVVDYDAVIVDRAALSREQVKSACRFLNPEENMYWDRALHYTTVTQVEDYVELTHGERENLIAEACQALEGVRPEIKDASLTYRLNLNEFTFAPNMAWTGWALQNAHRGDPRYCRTAFEANYLDGTMNITWRDESKATVEPPMLRSNYFSNVKKSKRLMDGF